MAFKVGQPDPVRLGYLGGKAVEGAASRQDDAISHWRNRGSGLVQSYRPVGTSVSET